MIYLFLICPHNAIECFGNLAISRTRDSESNDNQVEITTGLRLIGIIRRARGYARELRIFHSPR